MTTSIRASRAHAAAPRARHRRHHNHPRHRVVVRASTDDEWLSRDRVYILVYDLDTPREAIYTTSSRTSTRATNAFVVFESMRDAVCAAMALSEATREMPAVDEVPPAVMALLRESAGYDVEYMRTGTAFRVPDVIVDEGAEVGEGVDDAAARVLAISADDLAAYVSTSTSATSRADEDEMRIESARANAARVMRDALRAPVIAVRDAAKNASDAPVHGAKIYVSNAKAAMRAMLEAARRRGGDHV